MYTKFIEARTRGLWAERERDRQTDRQTSRQAYHNIPLLCRRRSNQSLVCTVICSSDRNTVWGKSHVGRGNLVRDRVQTPNKNWHFWWRRRNDVGNYLLSGWLTAMWPVAKLLKGYSIIESGLGYIVNLNSDSPHKLNTTQSFVYVVFGPILHILIIHFKVAVYLQQLLL